MENTQTSEEAASPPNEGRWRRIVGRLLRCAGFVLILVAWAWTCGALHYLVGVPAWVALGVFVGVPIAWWRLRIWRATIAMSATMVTLWMLFLFIFLTKPQTQRGWWQGNLRPPIVRIHEDEGRVAISNVRFFKWRTREDFDPSWVYSTYYLDKLDSLDLIVEPLGDSKLFAHTMLSFGFGPERRVVISIEARREDGEKFGVIPGIYKQFELFYQINDERDALTLRALQPDSNLYVFPVKASPEFLRELFLDMVEKAGHLVDNPEFYHSLKANCTTKLFEHVNRKLPEPLKFRTEIIFPSGAGKLLHELGWMDTKLDYEAARERFRLADKVREFAEHPEFSKKIRE